MSQIVLETTFSDWSSPKGFKPLVQSFIHLSLDVVLYILLATKREKIYDKNQFKTFHKPFWAESKAKIVSRLDHSGYYLNIEEVVHHLLVQDPQLQNLTSIYSLPPPRVDLKKVWLCCCRCCLKFRNQSFHPNLWWCLDWNRLAEVDSLSTRAQMAIKIFIRRLLAIFATNTPFLSVIRILQIWFSIKCNIYTMK